MKKNKDSIFITKQIRIRILWKFPSHAVMHWNKTQVGIIFSSTQRSWGKKEGKAISFLPRLRAERKQLENSAVFLKKTKPCHRIIHLACFGIRTASIQRRPMKTQRKSGLWYNFHKLTTSRRPKQIHNIWKRLQGYYFKEEGRQFAEFLWLEDKERKMRNKICERGPVIHVN